MKIDTVVCADFLELAQTVEDSSVNLIISDWPYFKVKNLDWDRQWRTPEEYLDWIGQVCEQYRRILAPNGSLYAFASPKMAWAVEGKIRDYFNVVNRITWRKGEFDTKAEMFPKDALRSFFPVSEIILFAEHHGADSVAKGESGYGAKCDELRGFVFEPLKRWFDSEWRRAGLTRAQVDIACGTSNVTQYWFLERNYQIPTAEKYATLNKLAPNYFLREYEDLRAEYEDLRRPFNVTAQDQYTDVWDFPTVKTYPGKHPCEKPLEMMEHIVKVSSRPGDVVGDFFCGSGGSLVTAYKMGRRYVGCDMLPKWAKRTNERLEKANVEMTQLSFCLDR